MTMFRCLLVFAVALSWVACGSQSSQSPPVRTAAGGDAPQAASPALAANVPSPADQSPAAPAPTATNPAPKEPMSAPNAYNPLAGLEAQVILHKGTERAFAGEYTDNDADGTYICRQCNAPLYRSADKFHSGCGWPSFDDEIADAVDRHIDREHGMVRVEITCRNCQGHLGHVFDGERMTDKNTRHCVNSVSMRFVAKGQPLPPKIVLAPK